MKIKNLFRILFVIFPIFIFGCPSKSGDNTNFYLSGTINVQSPTTVNVTIAYYSSDCIVYNDSQGNVTDLDNFGIIGSVQEVNILNYGSFQYVIPIPYESVGGILAWIDINGNNTPDPSSEQVILAKRNINGVSSIIIGLTYDETVDNFKINYENLNGTFQQYLSIIGNDDYSFDF